MSDSGQVARLLSQINDLQGQLAAAQRAQKTAEDVAARVPDLEKELEAAKKAQASLPQTVAVAVRAAREESDRAKVAAQVKMADALDARDAVQKKFDDLFGEAEPGSNIVRSVSYKTPDGRVFDNLLLAKRHQTGLDATQVADLSHMGLAVPEELSTRLANQLKES